METDMRLDSVQKRVINIPLARYQAGPTPHVSAALVSKFLRFTFKRALPCRDLRLQVTLCAPPRPPPICRNSKLIGQSVSDDSVAVPLILSFVSQEVARGGAAAEDVVPPGHPQPFPRALQSGQLPCSQSRLPASRRTLQRDLRKSHKHTAGIL